MTIEHFLGPQTLMVIVDDIPRVVNRTHPNIEEIIFIVSHENPTEKMKADLGRLMDPLSSLQGVNLDGSSVEIHENTVTFNGEELPSYLTERILDIVAAGLPVEPWKLFVERVYSNPLESARDELALFMEKAHLPLTPEGKFRAYKRVNSDYTDTYTGKIDNSVGKEVIYPGGRYAVDADRDRTCSNGLHFCSHAYLKEYYKGSGRIVILDVDPADVVAIPSDHNNTKGRCWKYRVVGEVDLTTEEKALEWGIIDWTYSDEDPPALNEKWAAYVEENADEIGYVDTDQELPDEVAEQLPEVEVNEDAVHYDPDADSIYDGNGEPVDNQFLLEDLRAMHEVEEAEDDDEDGPIIWSGYDYGTTDEDWADESEPEEVGGVQDDYGIPEVEVTVESLTPGLTVTTLPASNGLKRTFLDRWRRH